MDSPIFSSYTTFAISLSLLFLLTKLILSITTNNKKYPPGPPALPVIGHLHLFKKPLHHTLARLSASHGPILSLRFGSRPVLVVSSFPLAEECFTGANDVTFANRVRFPSVRQRTYDYTTIPAASYGPHWRNIRRVSTVEVLSSHRLASFAAVRSAEVQTMVQRLFKEINPSLGYGKVELKSRLFEFAFNNLMRMIAGKSYTAAGSSRRFQELVEARFATAGASNVGDFLPLVGWLDLSARRKEAGIAKFSDEFMQGLIDKIRREGKGSEDRKSMIGDLLSLQETDPEYYTDRMIKAIIISMIIAGTGTESDTIEWIISLLLNNPDKLKKAQDEIDERIRGDRLITESDFPNLPYLECVITESLRLYPVAPLLVPHESSEECVIGGYTVPKGTMLLVNAYVIHRDPSDWDEPEKFAPERFEGARGSERAKLLLPFGMGRRRCPGEGLARRVVGLLLGTLIQCFEWERVGDEPVDMTEGSGLTLPKVVPLEAVYRPRESIKGILASI